MEPLKPCPFCGKASIKTMKKRSKQPGKYSVYARCKICYSRGPYALLEEGEYTPEQEKEVAITMWNTRA